MSGFLEPFAVADVYASKLGKVEFLKGGNIRFTWVSEETLDDGTIEYRTVCKVVLSAEEMTEARKLTNRVMSGETLSACIQDRQQIAAH